MHDSTNGEVDGYFYYNNGKVIDGKEKWPFQQIQLQRRDSIESAKPRIKLSCND